MKTGLPYSIFSIKSQEDFCDTALEVFKYQAENNTIYKTYLKNLGKKKKGVSRISEIPFLPAGFFKSQVVLTEKVTPEKIFESSKTSGNNSGRHYVHDLKLYEKSFLEGFRLFYGDPQGYVITALLPSYTERESSSLVYMVNSLAEMTMHPASGFYCNRHADLIKNLQQSVSEGNKTMLLGVSFALLDLAEKSEPDLSGIIVMETGGMKGRRKEITRAGLHDILKKKFNIGAVHSEYGMTELLSQAYSKGNGIFYTPPWMKVLIRDPYDPLSVITESGKIGGIDIIDLANFYSCSFIATGDLGKLHDDGSFEVLGRFDSSDIRGCNLLME